MLVISASLLVAACSGSGSDTPQVPQDDPAANPNLPVMHDTFDSLVGSNQNISDVLEKCRGTYNEFNTSFLGQDSNALQVATEVKTNNAAQSVDAIQVQWIFTNQPVVTAQDVAIEANSAGGIFSLTDNDCAVDVFQGFGLNQDQTDSLQQFLNPSDAVLSCLNQIPPNATSIKQYPLYVIAGKSYGLYRHDYVETTASGQISYKQIYQTRFNGADYYIACPAAEAISDPLVPDPAVPDPLVQNSTRVDFDISVPAYVSDALQVRLVWGDKDISAMWVGDVFWSASDDFPTDTEHLLAVTFSDGNGDITLGRFENNYKTGTNASESYQITAGQFDTRSWDNDGDGVSNLDELIAGTDPSESPRVLLFDETRDFRHSSIQTALAALEELATSSGIQTDRAVDSAGLFTDENLARYDAVVWVMTSGDVLNADEQAAFERYIRSGGGYAGIHAASFTEYEWPWYGGLVGAYFDRHPEVQSATQVVENRSHQSTAHLGSSWTRTDEWYDYRTNPRAQVNVLLSLDENSYSGGGMGSDHPSAWYHEYDGGRSWYTGGGHTNASYAEPDFRAHLLGGLQYVTGRDGL